MPIYRKVITRSSSVTVAIEADSMEEANRIYGLWLDEDNDNNYEQLSCLLNERSEDTEKWDYVPFDNMDMYNRSSLPADDFTIFEADKKKSEEPIYEIWFKEGERDAYLYARDITLEEALTLLQLYNRTYYMKPNGIPNINAIVDANERGSHILYYKLTERSK